MFLLYSETRGTLELPPARRKDNQESEGWSFFRGVGGVMRIGRDELCLIIIERSLLLEVGCCV